MLYTIMPPEIVWENFGKLNAVQKINLNGRSLFVERISVNTAKIVKLESSDPQDYLKPEYQPGKLIEFVL